MLSFEDIAPPNEYEKLKYYQNDTLSLNSFSFFYFGKKAKRENISCVTITGIQFFFRFLLCLLISNNYKIV